MCCLSKLREISVLSMYFKRTEVTEEYLRVVLEVTSNVRYSQPQILEFIKVRNGRISLNLTFQVLL